MLCVSSQHPNYIVHDKSPNYQLGPRAHTSTLCLLSPTGCKLHLFVLLLHRANRLGLGSCSRLLLMSATCLDHILATMYAVRPTAVIVDSIQTVYLERHDNSAGSPTQVRWWP